MLGLYALSVMDRDGPIYGYSLADRISDRTEGAWRPGAGAIYPALRSLAEKGWARESLDGRRRIYRITPSGRTFLTRIRRSWAGGRRGGPDLSMLWSEIAGHGDPGQHLLRHLRHHLDGIATSLERDPAMKAGRGTLLDQVRAELRVAEARLDSLGGPGRDALRKRRKGTA